jgi:hypothetical protein
MTKWATMTQIKAQRLGVHPRFRLGREPPEEGMILFTFELHTDD